VLYRTNGAGLSDLCGRHRRRRSRSGVSGMRFHVGRVVFDPRQDDQARSGTVLEVRSNPACLMRTIVIRWLDDGSEELLEELAWGPLEDEPGRSP
jgi:hypothetical protein